MEIIETKEGTVYKDSMEVEIITKETSKAIRDLLNAKNEQIEAQQQKIQAQQQEIQQHIKWNEAHTKARVEQAELIDKLLKDKDEQAGNLMRFDTALKECVGLLKDSKDILKDLSGLFVESHKTTACTATLAFITIIDSTMKRIDALLGGKEDDSPSNNV